jgi:hypothetical protein
MAPDTSRISVPGSALSDHGHLAAGKGDIHHGVELLGGINDPAAAQDQIESHRSLLI